MAHQIIADRIVVLGRKGEYLALMGDGWYHVVRGEGELTVIPLRFRTTERVRVLDEEAVTAAFGPLARLVDGGQALDLGGVS